MSFLSKARLLWGSLWVAACCALAPGIAAAQDVLHRIATRKQVNVGYSENSPPFSFLVNGRPAGYSVDLCTQVVAEHLRQALDVPDLRVHLLPVSQDQLARFVGGGSVDLMCASVSDTPQRRATMHFSTPVFVAAVKLLVLGEDGPRNLSDLRNGTVAVLGRTTAEAAVQRASTRHGLDLRLSRVVSADAALGQLRLRQAQAWARDELLLLGSVAKEADRQRFTLLPEVLSTEPIAIAMPRDDRLRREVDEALARSVRSGRLQALYEAWFVQPNAATPTGFSMPLSGELKAEFDRQK